MNWTQVDIYTSTAAIDTLTVALQDLGIRGCMVRDAADFQEFLEQKQGRWDYLEEGLMELAQAETCVTVYLPEDAQGAQTLVAVRQLLDSLRRTHPDGSFGRLEAELCGIREEDWANNWKQYFKPFPVGERLYIKPSWEQPGAEAQNRRILEIDPASSFGSGQHYTTKLCLELLEEDCPGAERVLDLGCGSGILLIAALLLGAQCAVGVDIEENAVRIAGENAAQNHLDPARYSLYCGDILSDPALLEQIGSGFDLVSANIVADVLKAMAPLFVRLVRQGGTLILSGIIAERADEVIDTVTAQGFTEITRRTDGGWCAVKLTH